MTPERPKGRGEPLPEFSFKKTEPIPKKRYHEGTSSQRMESFSKSEDSGGGHWKSRSKKQKSSIEEDDLSQPWVCEETDPFTPVETKKSLHFIIKNKKLRKEMRRNVERVER
ncbi:hypothetical protein Tco_1480537, partial [Tanacetum coccineum]